MDITKIKLEKRKDYILYFLIAFSTLLIIYIMFYIIDFYSHNNILSRTPANINISKEKLAPNEVGDTIGGILNPIIAFSASILTFLAFYIQYQANKEQRAIYNKNLLKEKQEKEDNHFVNLEIFKTLIDSTISHYEQCAKFIVDFCEKEKSAPLSIHSLGVTPSSSYSTLKKMDFKDLYSSVVFNFKNKKYKWEKDFVEILNTVDFFDTMLDELRKDIKSYNIRKENKLNQITISITEEIEKSFIDPTVVSPKIMEDYTAIIYNRTDKNQPVIPDHEFYSPDLNQLYKDFLPSILERLESAKEFCDNGTKNCYNDLIKVLSNQYIRLDTTKILAQNYALDLQKNIDQYFEKNDDLNEVHIFLDLIKNKTE